MRGNHPAVQRVVLAWRRLVAGAPTASPPRTLIACSGGADSTALLLALGSATDSIAIAHVVHDLRPRELALADRDHVRSLAAKLGVEYAEREISVRAEGGNAEAAARRLRYAALLELAREHRGAFVATGHQADDQFESLIMALIRGSGLAGLRGIAPRRSLGDGVKLIRPMLGVTRADAEDICRAAGVEWRTDHTNLTGEGLRSKLRLGPLAQLAAIRPGAPTRAAQSADLIRQAHAIIRRRACEVFGDSENCWPRERLRAEPPIVLGVGLRRAMKQHCGDSGGMDRVGAKQLSPIIRSIKDRSTDPREFRLGNGTRFEVSARSVQLLR